MRGAITAIVPVRDTLYLRESIDSLLSGEEYLDTIIVYADGHVPDFARTEAAYRSHDKVQFIQGGTQVGPSVALNICLEKVTSDYTVFFSHDDVVSPTFFQSRSEFLSQGYDVLTTLPTLIDPTGKEKKKVEHSSFGRLDNSLPTEQSAQRLFLKLNFLCMPGTIVRTSTLREFGPFSPALLGLQDYEFWLWAFICDKKVLQVQDGAVRYRFHERNLSQQHTQRIDREYGYALWSCLGRCSEEQLRRAFPDSAVWFSSGRLSKDTIISLLLARHPKRPVAHYGLEKLIESLNGQQQLEDFAFSEAPRLSGRETRRQRSDSWSRVST